MPLDAAACYRAVAARDARFDGKFFTGVLSTGIFCRPVCPARTPRRDNCKFFPSAAAALTAGLRPCLRCRPETSPGTPAWRGSSAVVSRALRLIEQGALDGAGVPKLCDRLGVGERHLRRLFDKRLGASPGAVAQTRRLLTAKRLLSETAAPLPEVASAAGYGSVRRLHEAVSAAYGRPPSALRAVNGRGSEGTATVRLAFRPPYQREAMLAFLGTRAIPGVEAAEGGVYRRTIRTGDGAARLEARFVKDDLEVRFEGLPTADLPAAVDRVRWLFDLGGDPDAVAGALTADRRLEPLVVGRPGLRVPGAWDPFELAVRAVLGQQVTVAGASTLAGRLVERFGGRVEGDAPNRLFPLPAGLADAPLEEIGLPRRRAETIRALAASGVDFASGDARERLLAMPGVGEWTAEYVAMRALGDPDAFPAGDLGLRRAWARIGGAVPLAEAAGSWRPWRAYAAMYLWTSEAD